MKKLLSIFLIALLPQIALAAVTVPFVATSTTQGWISPSRINGNEQTVLSQNFIATSTSLDSIFPHFTFTFATGTSATTTNLFSTTASTTNLFGTLINGFGLATCIGTNALTWTGGSFTCTAQPQGTVTSVGLADSNSTLTIGNTPITSSGNITATFNLSHSNIWSALQTFGDLLVNGSTTLQNYTAQNATTTNFNLTSNHITFGGNYVNATVTPAFNVASTTIDAMGHSFSGATTSLILANFPETRILRSYYCVASSTGSVVVRFNNNGTFIGENTCSTTGNQTVISANNQFSAFTNFTIEIGSSASSPSRVTITPVMNKVSD